MNSPPNDFAALILTHGRPDNVITYRTLRRKQYTGPIVVVVDDMDKTIDQYRANFGDEVEVFSKREIAETFDQCDNFTEMRSIVYARNAAFDIAKRLGYRYFIQLDDDYSDFSFRFNQKLDYHSRTVQDLNRLFTILLEGYKAMRPLASLAIAQGGDFLGGDYSDKADAVKLLPKAMNTFICDTENRFQFIGRVNEDVNTYTHLASQGLVLRTTNQASIQQMPTQSNEGGMTDLYLASGTYVKSFYTVMLHPSGVRAASINSKNARIHHQVFWRYTAPKLLRETHRKRSN